MRTAAFVLVLVLAAATAHANGRNDLTSGIYLRPGDPHSLYVRSTFGLLVSHDDGCTLYWICEDNVGYGGVYDPLLAIASDGTVYATTEHGLRVTRDGGCSFQTVTADTSVAGLDLSSTGEIWISTDSPAQPNDVLSSTDGGMTFLSKGMQSSTIRWTSVRVAPSDPQRIYVAGYELSGVSIGRERTPPTPHLAVSGDGGAGWKHSLLTGMTFGSPPDLLIAAIDPANPATVYVAAVGANQGTGDRLFRSTDSGMTFHDVLETTAPIHDLVIHDAQTVFVTTLISHTDQQTAGPAYVSTDGGLTFGPLPHGPQLACLVQRSDGVMFGCGTNWDPDFKSIATSPDGGATWHRVWRFDELAGPLSCPDGTAEHDTCAVQEWAMVKSNFAPSGPSCGSNVLPDAPPSPRKSSAGGGCCEVGDAGAATVGWLFGLGWLVRRRRPRR